MAAIAVNQSTSVWGNGVSSVTTPTINTTSGNLLVADVVYYFVSNAYSSLVDNNPSTTWTAESIAEQSNVDSASRQRYLANITGKTGYTLTFNSTGTDYPSLVLREIVNADKASPLAENGTGTGTSSPYSYSLSVTCPPNKLLLSHAGCNEVGPSTDTVTQTGSFTQDQNLGGYGISERNLSSHLYVTASGSYAMTWTTNTNENYSVGIAAFSEAGDILFAQAAL